MWKSKDSYRPKQTTKLIAGALIIIISFAIGFQELFFVSEYLNGNLDWADTLYRCLAMLSVWFICMIGIALSVKDIQ